MNGNGPRSTIGAVTSLLMYLLLVAAFLRMGRGLWFRTWPGGIGKAVLLTAVLVASSVVGMFPVLYLSLIGASLGS